MKDKFGLSPVEQGRMAHDFDRALEKAAEKEKKPASQHPAEVLKQPESNPAQKP